MSQVAGLRGCKQLAGLRGCKQVAGLRGCNQVGQVAGLRGCKQVMPVLVQLRQQHSSSSPCGRGARGTKQQCPEQGGLGTGAAEPVCV